MEITCPSCSKRYRVEDSLIPDGGRNVKCRKCGHMFRVEKPRAETVDEGHLFELNLNEGESGYRGGLLDSTHQPVESHPQVESEGTVRISREQIEASLRSSGASEMTAQETDDAPGIQLDQNRMDEVRAKSVDLNPEEMPDQPVKKLNNLYRVRIDGKEYTGLTMEDIKQWINEDRLLENDEVCRHGSVLWVKAETVPEFKKIFSLHVYQQRKQFDEMDNPYIRFKEREEKASADSGILGKIKSFFRGR